MKAIRYFCIGAVLVVAGLLGARACLTAVWTLPPLPAVPAAPLTTPQRVSTLVLPIRFELAELSRLVNEMVPTHQEGTENSPETRPVLHFHGALRRPTTTREPIAHVDWHVDRGPLQVAGRNDHLQVSATLTGGGRLVPPDLKGSFKGSVSADATVAIGHDYAFVPTVAPDARLDQLKLGFLDVSGLARNKAHQVAASYGPQLSQKIAQAVKFKEHVANVNPRDAVSAQGLGHGSCPHRSVRCGTRRPPRQRQALLYSAADG